MPRSDEHDFVTKTFIEYAHQMSRSELFGYGEADRGRFDFACVLTRDYSRQLVGQTLTHHAAGIDKDLASLLFEPGGELPIYLFSHEARNESRIQEFLRNARKQMPERVALLRLYRYPAFDADKDEEREAVRSALRNQVLDDLVLNVLFGRLQASDIDILLQGTGIQGLLLAVLDQIALNGFFNFPELGRALSMNPSTIRPRVFSLFAAGMLDQMPGGSMFRVTTRARVLLRICHLILRDRLISPELEFVLQRLGIGSGGVAPAPQGLPELSSLGYSPFDKLIRLLSEAHAARQDFGARFPGVGYPLSHRLEGKDVRWVGR
jgi:hypothetical protein